MRNRVVFWENLHNWHKFYTTTGRDGRDKSQLWINHNCSQVEIGEKKMNNKLDKCIQDCLKWNFNNGELDHSEKFQIAILAKKFLCFSLKSSFSDKKVGKTWHFQQAVVKSIKRNKKRTERTNAHKVEAGGLNFWWLIIVWTLFGLAIHSSEVIMCVNIWMVPPC